MQLPHDTNFDFPLGLESSGRPDNMNVLGLVSKGHARLQEPPNFELKPWKHGPARWLECLRYANSRFCAENCETCYF